MAHSHKHKGSAGADGKELGISKGIYAAGYALKDGLIWGTIATIGSYAILAFGRKDGNFVDKTAILLTKGHAKFKEMLGEGVGVVAKAFGKKVDPKHASESAITATALIAGGIVGHLAQGPAVHKGLMQAQKLDDKYNNVMEENEQLKQTNAQLMSENRGYRDKIGESASFADRAAKPEVEISRG